MTDRFVTVPDSLELPAAVKVPVARLHDSTAAGRALLTGADAAAQRSSLGLGWVDAATGMDLLTRTALRTGQSVQPPTLQRVTSTPTGTGPRFIEKVGDLLYGIVGATGAIHTSPDGYTWTQVNATWPGASGFISRLVPTSDGEMIALTATEVRKSTGWSTNPATATWSPNKITPNADSVFVGFGLSGGNSSDPYDEACDKLILVEYNSTPATWSQSRYGHISTDGGTTWTRVYDTLALHGEAASEVSHLHAACYDPWADVFYIGEGHGPAGGVYWSADAGHTWAGPLRVESTGSVPNNAPTVIHATDDGLVMGSDNAENGIFGMVRKTNPGDQRILWNWQLKTGRDGLVTFAQRSWRDPDTGLVYVTFRAEYADTPLTIAAGTAGGAGLVYELPDLPVMGGADRFAAVAKLGADTLFVYGELQGVPRHFRGTLTKPGTLALSRTDTGHTLGGRAGSASSLAVGRAAAPALQSVAVGQGARTDGAGGTVVGYGATTSSTEGSALGKGASAGNGGTAVGANANAPGGVAVGYGAKTLSTAGVAIGGGAEAESEAVAIGHATKALAAQSTVVGRNATGEEGGVALGYGAAVRYRGVALGRSAQTTANDAVALGHGAVATLDSVSLGHGATTSGVSNSIALGKGTAATSNAQVHIGARHLAITTLGGDATAPAGGDFRIYAKDDGGRLGLFVRDSAGIRKVTLV